ncbi:Serp1 [Myxoma virus]|uniref:M8.1 n=1 Tax=Myxoma virus TaxID=10273 RepID=A0A481NGT1_9POXV|nr:m8.1 [Myxoma virus]QAV34637.1 Serp1 [Myxoma virus]QAV35335.1 m8.1 [Myxoma virus]QAV35482.1 Serp1 [Myxoma virus]QAV35504.1 m8.1 [Myxoma virus]
MKYLVLVLCLTSCACRDIGLWTFRYVYNESDNVVFSPYGLTSALSVLRIAAGGNTKREIDVPESVVEDSDAFLALRELFVDASVPLRPEFTAEFSSRFNTSVQRVTFNSENVKDVINSYVKDKTGGDVPRVLDASLDRDTKMLLLSSVRMKTSWRHVFDPSFTTDQPFYSGNVTYKVRMMNKIDTLKTETFTLRNVGYSVTELPYKRRQTAMLLVVPDDLGEIVRALDLSLVRFWIRNMRKDVCQVVMPKFSVESVLDLRNALQRLGVRDAFDPSRADFGQASPSNDLYVTKVLQTSKIEADERGTTASSDTAITLIPRNALTAIVANKPFMFLIYHKPTTTVLFMGTITKGEKVIYDTEGRDDVVSSV